MTATDASRNFSELLGRVSAGESIEIVRNGTPVANVTPPGRRLWTASAFRELMAAAPPVDDDFATDVADVRRSLAPPVSPWPS